MPVSHNRGDDALGWEAAVRVIDGYTTYDAKAAPRMGQRMIDENLDFVNGARVSEAGEAYRKGTQVGNYVLTALVRNIFGKQFTDMLWGYTVLSPPLHHILSCYVERFRD